MTTEFLELTYMIIVTAEFMFGFWVGYKIIT